MILTTGLAGCHFQLEFQLTEKLTWLLFSVNVAAKLGRINRKTAKLNWAEKKIKIAQLNWAELLEKPPNWAVKKTSRFHNIIKRNSVTFLNDRSSVCFFFETYSDYTLVMTFTSSII